MRLIFLLLGGVLFTCSLSADFLPANPPTLVPASGTVTDYGKAGTQIYITWTGSIPRKGGQVNTLGSTAVMTVPDTEHGTGSVSFPVPAKSTSPNGVTQPVKDYVQYAQDPGPISVLMLEAFVPDPDGTDFDQYGFLDYINLIVGADDTIWVPDLYSTTDQTSDAVLYEAVNLSVYMANLPTFAIGDTFDVANGVAAGLPGMIFGTSEMTLDPDSPDGFDNPDPYTGTGFALSEHGNTVTPTPEPGTTVLLVSFVLVLGPRVRARLCLERKR